MGQYWVTYDGPFLTIVGTCWRVIAGDVRILGKRKGFWLLNQINKLSWSIRIKIQMVLLSSTTENSSLERELHDWLQLLWKGKLM